MVCCLFTLVIITFSLLYYYFKKQQNYFKDRGIPYLEGWPIFGNMAGPIFHRKHISEVVREIYSVNPDAKYAGVLDFVRPVIMIRDPELIKNITIKNFDNFPDHKAFIDDTVDPLFGGGLFNLAGERWREARNLLSPAFTSSKIKAMFGLMVDCGKNFVNYINDLPESDRKLIATKSLFAKFTNDVIASCAFGVNVDSLKHPNNEFLVLGREATTFEGIQSLKFFMARAFPRIMKMLKIKFVSDRAEKFFKQIVSTTVATRDEKGISRPDMLQLMMDARGRDKKHLKLDITEITSQVFIFFFGGFDTTSSQLCIIAHELALNPDIQAKLQDEIDGVSRKTDGNPTYEVIQEMTYLDAVFNESLRRHTLFSYIDRLCTKAFELPPAVSGGKPFTLEPGMSVWIPAAAIHSDPNYYDNPEEFNPDRYYQKKVTINDVTNLGFGIGPRGCIGNRFAIMEIKILLFFLLSKFTLKPNVKTCAPLRYNKQSFTIAAEGGFWIAMEPRT